MEQQGLVPRLLAALFGPRVARLTEQRGRTHWLSYLLIIAQSIAVVLVFGHAEVGLLFNPNVAIQAFAVLALFLLVATVLASDVALVETIKRILPLARNRQTWALIEHVAYVVFVLLVEGVTYGIVLYALDSDPQSLVEGRPLIPTVGWVFLGVVVLRVTLTCWASVQLIIVSNRLPVLLSTLINAGKEIVGAHTERALQELDIKHVALPDLFRTYAEMARPPRPIAGFWNTVLLGAPLRRALAREAEEERQAHNVLGAIRGLSGQATGAGYSAEAALDDVRRDLHLPLPEPTTPLHYRPRPVQLGRPSDAGPEGPDDDGPDGGARLPDHLADPGVWPAMAAITGVGAPVEQSGRRVGRAQGDDDPATSSGRRKQPRLSREDRERLKTARQDARKTIIRQMLAANPDVTVNAIYEELRSPRHQLGTNVSNIKFLLGTIRRDRIRAVQ